MSATPTPSASSGQTIYYDAVLMEFTLNDSTGKVAQSGSVSPRPAAPGITNNIAHGSQMEGASSPMVDPATPKTHSLRSLPVDPAGQEQHTSGIRTATGETSTGSGTKGSIQRTKSAHTSGMSSAFINGAPLTGPDAEPDVDRSFFDRGAKAERTLSQKQKNRIAKEEKGDVRKFSKLLRMEASTEKVALDSALKNLSSLQSLHKAAIKRETGAQASHARTLSAAQKAGSKFQEEKARSAEVRARAEARCMEERARWEGKQGEVRAQQERLDAAKEAVKETELRIAECAREVERLRIVKATDEREREARLTELEGKK